MLIDKQMCNFRNCKYHLDGNCRDASKYENCTLTDLHSEIARLRVDLDNAKADTVREMQERFENSFDKLEHLYNEEGHENFVYANKVFEFIDQIAKEMLEAGK